VKRRTVLVTTALLPFAARAQPARKRRVGVLLFSANPTFVRSLAQAMHEIGYVEGQNLELIVRDGVGRADLLERGAAELVREQVEAIVVWSTDAALAAQRATRQVPIVASVADPLGSGLVKSLARPESNLTGISSQSFEVAGKRIELLIQALSAVRSIAFLGLKNEFNLARFLEVSRAVASKAGVDVRLAEAPTAAQFEATMTEAVKLGAQAMVLQQIFLPQSTAIAALALALKLPTAGWQRPFVEAGGLLSFGAVPEDNYLRLARMLDRLLAGMKPADLPVEQATRTELLVNVRTARLLGVTLPPLLLARADEVIE
jgi:putative ABC transport system substrate-binding protein